MDIKSISGKLLISVDGDNLGNADLVNAYLRNADLGDAYLVNANLRNADLVNANLRNANLRDADLRSAFIDRPQINIMKHSESKLFAFKMVTKEYKSPINGNLSYNIGDNIEVKNSNIDERVTCAAGINVADETWIKHNWCHGRLLLVSFYEKDIAAIPYATDGKFRLHRCTVEKEILPSEIGIKE